MKDIKSLYLTAKNSGKSTDISAYSEAINDLIEANPNEYIANLEYIISSSIGLDTLNEFVERYGIPISYYDTLTNMLESCIHKAEVRNKDSSKYKEELEKMESFRKKYIGCFMMESYFHDMLPEKYLETYYSLNSKGIQNRKLLTGMIERFGEAAIPDIIITAHNISNDAMNTAIQYIESHDRLGTPGTCEWLLEATKNLLPENDPGLLLLESSSLSKIIKDMKERNNNLYRESIIMGKDEVKFEYTESDVCSLHDLIEITEYKLTWGDELFESVEDIHKDIISLYEEFDGLLDEDGNPETFDEDVADSVVPMLPNGQVKPVEESKWLVNTRNKKTGDAPGYLKKNHNLGYGEDDDLGMNNNEPKSSSEEIKLDDFKRPSEEDISGTSNSFSGFDDNKEDGTKEMTPAEKQAAINNYYYYTYTNSLNKNTTGSYNHDNDNSRNTNSKNTTGSYNHDNDNSHDNSNSKNTTGSYNHDNDNSHDISRDNTGSYNHDNNNSRNGTRKDEDKVDDNKPVEECVEPWTLNISPTSIMEKGDVNFLYTYRTVKAKDGNYYLITFEIDGPKVTNYKLHYADINNATVKFVGTISGNYLRKYGNDNYASKGNKIIKITDIKTGKSVNSIVASGGVPADGRNINKIGTTDFLYKVGDLSPLTYKSTVPIYPMAGTVSTAFGSMKGINVNNDITMLNPFSSRRIDFSKPLLYKERYTQLAILLKSALLEMGNNIKSFRKTSLTEIESIIDKNIKSNPLYNDYLISPLPIEEYKEILLKSSMFVRNCAENIIKSPWNSIPNIYKGLLVGFFGPPVGESYKYINIDIMEPITSKKYKVNTNIFQNIEDWFTLIANALATAVAVSPKKNLEYHAQEETARKLIKDTFYSKNTDLIYGVEKYEIFEEDVLERFKEIISGINLTEAVGDADDNKPESDHPIKDILTDVDRELTKKQQEAKKKVQNVQNVGRAFMKPVKRTEQWIKNMVYNWKDADENNIKEKMADPHARSNLFSAIKTAITGGSLLKAGLLLNPVFLFLTVTRGVGKNKREFRIRNEMIGELKTELEVIEEKIKDVDRVGDNPAKYKLMRLKNEINKKLLRVGGHKSWKKMI